MFIHIVFFGVDSIPNIWYNDITVIVHSGLSIYCSDREKMIQGCINPIAAGDFAWIYACYCERVNSNVSLGAVGLGSPADKIALP
jgi:hypothetical protein